MFWNVIAQIFGIGAMVCLFLIYQQSGRKKLLICKLCADICWAVYYWIPGLYGGMIPNFVGIFREVTYTRRDKSKWASGPWVPILFVCINLTLGILLLLRREDLHTYDFPVFIHLIPVIASCIITVALWFRRPHLTKLASLPVATAFLIYACICGKVLAAMNECIGITSIVIYLIRERRSKHE